MPRVVYKQVFRHQVYSWPDSVICCNVHVSWEDADMDGLHYGCLTWPDHPR